MFQGYYSIPFVFFFALLLSSELSASTERYYCFATEFEGDSYSRVESMNSGGILTPQVVIKGDSLGFYMSNVYQKDLPNDLFNFKRDYSISNNEVEENLKSLGWDIDKFSLQMINNNSITAYFLKSVDSVRPAHVDDGHTPMHVIYENDGHKNISYYDCFPDFIPRIKTNEKYRKLEGRDLTVINMLLSDPVAKWNDKVFIYLDEEEVFRSAEIGNAKAMLFLARSYEYGINGFDEKHDYSFYWYMQAEKAGSKIEAYLGLASLNAHGKFLDKNYQDSNDLLRMAVDEIRSSPNDLDGKLKQIGMVFALGNLFLGDNLDLRNFEEINLLKQSDPLYQNVMIRSYSRILSSSQPKKSLSFSQQYMSLSLDEKALLGSELKRLFSLVSDSNNVEGMYQYARFLTEGAFPVEREPMAALKIYKKITEACDLENSQHTTKAAAGELARFFGRDGVVKDFRESYKWLNIAAFMGEQKMFTDVFLDEFEGVLTTDLQLEAQSETRAWLKRYCGL